MPFDRILTENVRSVGGFMKILNAVFGLPRPKSPVIIALVTLARFHFRPETGFELVFECVYNDKTSQTNFFLLPRKKC